MRFTLFDRWGNPLGDIQSVLDAKRTRGTDGTDTLDITVIGEINKDERIIFRDSMGRWGEYICRYPETERSSGEPTTTAYCSGSVCELSKIYIEDRRNRSATAEACLAKALDGTKWKVGTVQAGLTAHQADLAFYHEFVSDALQDICDTFGLELQTRIEVEGSTVKARYIDLLEQRGDAESTRRFEYRKDLPSIKRTVDSDNIITRLWCWGKGVEQTDENGEATGGYSRKIGISDVNDGKPYIDADASTLAQWGIIGADGKIHPAEGSYEDGDIDDPAKLLAAGKAYLAKTCKPSVSYTATVATLGRAGFDPEGVDVGDSVQIIDSAFTPTLRLEGRVLKIEEDLIGTLADTTLTLGNITQSYTQRMAAQKQQLDKLINSSGAWNDAAGGKGVYIADLIDRINQIMNETGGYVYQTPNQGIYVYDKPIDQHPTQVIQIGGGYWRCASSKKANGDWNWRSLANGKGIFADAIYTGLLSDAAGYNSWNLDTGDFKLSSRTTVGGKTVDAIAGDSSSAALAAAKKYADQMKRESDQTDLDNLAAAKDYAQAKAEEARKNALASASTDATNKANAALEAAKKAAQAYVDALDESLGQKSVFDRLTNYGKIQGLFMENGNLYANASYVKSGVLDANLVKAGILTDKKGLQYWDMTTGEFRLAGTSTIAGNKASDLATTTAARRLTSEAEAAAKKYADGIGTDTLTSAKADAASKANAAQSAAAADATKKANSAEANAKKAASTDATNKANAALEAAKKAAADGDTSTLEAAKSYADNTATSHVNTFEKSLTQQYIFNKLTDGGKLQGLYMSNNLLYVNATYLRSGIISGARSYWNLDSGIFSMSDANGVETVHLDGNGSHNTLTGTFQTGTSGSRLWMSPSFKQTPVGGTADITGAGISFIHATTAAQHPYIAAESTNSELGEISTLTFNGGRRADTDPGAFVRVGSTKNNNNNKKEAIFQALALRDYSVASSDAKSSGARLVSFASPATDALDTYAEIASWDPNGVVGVQADINTGYLYMGGFLGGYTNRHTFVGSAAWQAWKPNGGSISVGASVSVHFSTGSPAKYGRYYAVANADGEWGGIVMHVKNTGGQSGWDIQLYNADRNPCSVTMWCETLGWLVK
ncbi:Phage minor structural protein [Bifidobacterium adolescentis]|uniref:phage tail protein n=1 Tax=Bifidobacterium adolescentis TaxID=1680 RepID=UPI000585DDE2|nr:phage tail protein [Bifidobacterium adolescentis]AJE06528.1 Phage minor structural protein [Bifidobacterium adolescentis]